MFKLKLCPHLCDGVHVGLAVQATYPPPVQGLVVLVVQPQRGLALVGGAVARLQAGLLVGGEVLGPGPDHLCRLHISVSLVLRPVCRRKSGVIQNCKEGSD